jgi:hypothetical protein
MPYGKGEEKKKQILAQGHSGHTLDIILSSQYRTKQGVPQCRLAISIKKYLKAKAELRKLKYVIIQKYNLQKIL